MARVWLSLVCSFVIFTASSGSSQAEPTPYFIIMAKTLHQKGLHYILFSYQGSTESSYAVQIDSRNPFSGDKRTGEKEKGQLTVYKIPFENYQENKIELNFTIFSCSSEHECSTVIAKHTRVLPVVADPSVNLIQISQSSYHRNETVRFRILSYVSNTVALTQGKFDEIFIENSKLQLMHKWKNVSLLDAFEGLNYTLSETATLGTWRINFVIGPITDYEEFQVNNKRKAMFTVKLQLPKYLRLDARYFSFNVCAEYPYVRSMEASINASFCINEIRYVSLKEGEQLIRNCIEILQGLSDIKECMDFKNQDAKSLNMKLGLNPYSYLSRYETRLTVRVEQNNGYFVEKTVIGEAGNEQMIIQIHSPFFYKPGLPYQGTVYVKFKDKMPVVNATVKFYHSNSSNKDKYYQTDNEGSFRFGFPTMSGDEEPIEINFLVVEHRELSTTPGMIVPRMSKVLKASVSKTGGFIQIEVDESSCSRSTRTIPFKLKSTIPINANDIRAAVISERNFTSYYPFINTPIREICEDMDDDLWGHYKCDKVSDIPWLQPLGLILQSNISAPHFTMNVHVPEMPWS